MEKGRQMTSKILESVSLAEALPLEQKRVRELVKLYRDPMLKGNGEFAARLMEECLALAEKSSAEGDIAGMITAYHELKEYKV